MAVAGPYVKPATTSSAALYASPLLEIPLSYGFLCFVEWSRDSRERQMSSPGATHFTGTAARSLIPRAEPSDKSYDSCKLTNSAQGFPPARDLIHPSDKLLLRFCVLEWTPRSSRRGNTDRAYHIMQTCSNTKNYTILQVYLMYTRSLSRDF